MYRQGYYKIHKTKDVRKGDIEMSTIKVEQFITRGGRAAANQYIIHNGEETIFQSYNTIIAKKDKKGKIFLDVNYWDYSTTTGRYRNDFLGEGIAQTRDKIKSGEYRLIDLN